MKLFGRRKRKPFCADLAEHLHRMPESMVTPPPSLVIRIDGTLTKQNAEQLSEALHRAIRSRGGRP